MDRSRNIPRSRRAAQLAAQAPVFFDQIVDDLPFPPGEPAGQAISSSGRASAEKWNATGLGSNDVIVICLVPSTRKRSTCCGFLLRSGHST